MDFQAERRNLLGQIAEMRRVEVQQEVTLALQYNPALEDAIVQIVMALETYKKASRVLKSDRTLRAPKETTKIALQKRRAQLAHELQVIDSQLADMETAYKEPRILVDRVDVAKQAVIDLAYSLEIEFLRARTTLDRAIPPFLEFVEELGDDYYKRQPRYGRTTHSQT